MGSRESYTPNSHMCHCRHNCTNYDKLIEPLDRDIAVHQVYYDEIRDRITDMLENAIQESDNGDIKATEGGEAG